MAAAGDIACGSGSSRFAPCKQFETSELLVDLRPAVVLALGDIQYEDGALEDFQRFYDLTWGRFKPITAPVVGNHEYHTRRAAGYFDYFNGVGVASGTAGHRGEGWYSFRLGSWLVLALNSNCGAVGGCGPTSPQVRWLRATLEGNAGAACTLAFWHHPRFSSGKSQNDVAYLAFWEALHAFRADVVVVAHDHSYERFAPQDPRGAADPERGIRQFVVGTGGHSLQPLRNPLPNSEARDDHTFGVLALRLRPGRYEWEFRPVPGSTFRDAGADRCR